MAGAGRAYRRDQLRKPFSGSKRPGRGQSRTVTAQALAALVRRLFSPAGTATTKPAAAAGRAGTPADGPDDAR